MYDLSSSIEAAQNHLAVLLDPLMQRYADLFNYEPFFFPWQACIRFSDNLRVDYSDLIELPGLNVTDREILISEVFELTPIAGFPAQWNLTLFATIPDEERQLLKSIGKIQTVRSSYDALVCGGAE